MNLWLKRQRPAHLILAAAAIVILAAAPRLVVALGDPAPFLFPDSGQYIAEADHWYPSYSRPLGYSVFLSFVFAFARDLSSVAAMQAALGILSIVGFTWLGARFLFRSPAACLIFAALAALDVTVLVYERWILSESLSIALLVPHFYCLFRLLEDERGRFGLATGLSIGALILVRNVFVVCIPVVAAALALDHCLGPGKRPIRVWLTMVLRLTLGVAIPLTFYSQYHIMRTGHSGLTHFDGYSLWNTAGHPAICSTRPWSLAKGIICRSEPALNNDVGALKRIWTPDAPVRDIEETLGNRVDTNSALRRLAFESILTRPLAYARETVNRAREILFKPERFTFRHRIPPWLVEIVESRWGPDAPSLHASDARIWDLLRPITRINLLWGLVLIGVTVWAVWQRWWEVAGSTLMLWTWGYILLCALTVPASSRFRVIVALPILMLVVLAGERLVEATRRRRAGGPD